MGSLLIVALVAGLTYLWLRAGRIHRRQWLGRLNLPGTWACDDQGNRLTLELSGELDRGSYVESSNLGTERGGWRLSGHTMTFQNESGTVDCDLRLFDEGRIGIDGPGRERRLYERQLSNVVPLRSQQ